MVPTPRHRGGTVWLLRHRLPVLGALTCLTLATALLADLVLLPALLKLTEPRASDVE